ncbi:hypothetical protein UlMin_008946 [Ulmus minor]
MTIQLGRLAALWWRDLGADPRTTSWSSFIGALREEFRAPPAPPSPVMHLEVDSKEEDPEEDLTEDPMDDKERTEAETEPTPAPEPVQPERVACVSYMLRKGAQHWWSTVKMTRDVTVMSWADFIGEFNQKYYNSAILRVQEDEFLNLKQATMTVIEAVNKFEQLSRLCPSMIRTEEDKLRRIMDMLRPDITLAIESGGSLPRTVAKCVERAIRIEYRMA